MPHLVLINLQDMSLINKLHLLFCAEDCSWYAVVITFNAFHAVEA